MRHSPLGPGAEFDLIRSFLAGAARQAQPVSDAVRLGPGDDCAVVTAAGLAISVDMSVEGVHFQRDWLEPQEIGYRAAAAALSDLAAMAARPIGVLVALALRADDVPKLALRIMDGVCSAAERYGAVLLGGDTTRSPGPIVIDVVVVGEATHPVTRSGARPGDSIWVTGALGAAAAAVHAWRAGRSPEPAARHAFASPPARTAEAAWLARRVAAVALIDVSDGLAGDVAHLAAASAVGITLDAAAIPIHPVVLAAGVSDPLRMALSGGEDYELCFAARPGAVEPIIDEFTAAFGLALTKVGVVDHGEGVKMRGMDGTIDLIERGGWDHFAGSDG